MNKTQLEEAVKNNSFKFNHSDDCVGVLEDILDAQDVRELDQNATIEDLDNFADILWENLDGYVMYYSDNWNYLQRYGDTDFSAPFSEGFVTISQLHYYYLEREVYDAIREITDEY